MMKLSEKPELSMAVSVTLVFADEFHREAWLGRIGLFDGDRGPARRKDYDARKAAQNLIYTVGPIEGDVQFAPGTDADGGGRCTECGRESQRLARFVGVGEGANACAECVTRTARSAGMVFGGSMGRGGLLFDE